MNRIKRRYPYGNFVVTFGGKELSDSYLREFGFFGNGWISRWEASQCVKYLTFVTKLIGFDVEEVNG